MAEDLINKVRSLCDHKRGNKEAYRRIVCIPASNHIVAEPTFLLGCLRCTKRGAVELLAERS